MICRFCHKDAPDGLYCIFCGKRQDAQRTQRKRGNGQGTAYKRGSKWEGCRPGYQFTDEDGNHRVRPRKCGFSTKKEALEWACTTTDQEEHSPKVIDLWQMYLDNDLPKLSANRQVAYKKARKRLEPLMGMEIHLVTLDALQTAVNASCKTFYPARDCKTVMKALFKKALASNSTLVTKNLADYIVLPTLEEKDSEPFTQDEVTAFWNLFQKNDYFAPYILLLCYTGMMPAELLACRKDMVDLDNLEIFGCGKKTKKRKDIGIVFPEALRPVVETILKSYPKSPKLIAINKDNFYTEYYECLERAKVRKLPPYSCRHTYGTEAVRLGVHPAVVQKMLRHSNTKTQEKYTHLNSADAHEAANLMRGTQVAHNNAADA